MVTQTMASGAGHIKRRRAIASMGWRSCSWCGATIRKEEVLVGRKALQVAHLWIDRWPHPEGRVIQRTDDGKLRLLRPSSRRPSDTVKSYRVHSEKECAK